MTPKSLLRLPEARSSFDDMIEGSTFQRLIPSTCEEAQNVKKIVFCSGKVYYELVKERSQKHLKGEIAITRIEQVGFLRLPFFLLKVTYISSL